MLKVSEVKQILKQLKKEAGEEAISRTVTIGKTDICCACSSYGVAPHREEVRLYDDEAFNFGWRAKWIIEHLLSNGEIIEG